MDFIQAAATVITLLLALVILLDKLWSGRICSHDSNSGDNADSVDSASKSVDSNPPPLPIGEYEVFLNFRGPDTRHQITEILYHFLVNLKIRTFKDDDELRKGEGIWPNLVVAIDQSKIYVPIFSENYAYSKWCLKELAAIAEHQEQNQGCIILPIFYMVDPRDVRHQSGPYHNAFEEHKKNFDKNTIQAWKDALNKVGALKGWHIKSNNEQVAIADLVTGTVWSHISKNNYALETDKLVGIVDHIEAVKKIMALESPSMTIVGLHGMGGIGKTTIAKAVYNKVYAQFDRYIFVENVREMLEYKDGVIILQKHIISNILRANYGESIANGSEGIKIIRDRISRFKFLIVLDDVDEKFEFEKILGNIESFVSRSRFIITSRNVKVLRTLTVDCNLYRVREMSHHHSLQLFCNHAFRKDTPPSNYETLSKEIVSIAAGLPLTLKIVGSLLFQEDEVIWEDKLRQLKEIPEEEVVKRLKISYDSLNEEAKQIFLDIACFFNGEDKEMPFYMWSDCDLFPITNINILNQRSLIEIGLDYSYQDRKTFPIGQLGDMNNWLDYPGKIQKVFLMHDQLRDMSREIVRQQSRRHPSKRSRIWSEKKALDMLRNKKGTDQVECIRIISSSNDIAVQQELEIVANLESECFMNLSELRYFDVKARMRIDDFSNHLPNLRWLRLNIGSSECVRNICVENLVILELSSAFKDDCGSLRHIMEVASKLKVLKLLGESLTEYPSFPHSGSLEILYLEDFRCYNKDLDIGNLGNLKVMSLHRCVVREIRGGTVGMMKGLRELIIIHLLFQTASAREAFADIGDLQFLEFFLVSGCHGSVNEKMLLGTKLATSLEELETISPGTYHPELVEFEKRLVQLGFEIPADGDSNVCWKFFEPGDLILEGTMKKIPIKIHTSRPSPLSLLPSSLTSLDIQYCSELVWLPNLENLENLTELCITASPLLKEIPGLGGMKSLEILTLGALRTLCNLDGLDSLCSLVSLTLSGCQALERLPSLESLSKLHYLRITFCVSLKEIQGLGGLKSLQELKIWNAESLTRLLGFETLLTFNKLENLYIAGCPLLTSIPFHLDDEYRLEAPVLYSLKKLHISGAPPLLQIFCRMLQLLMFPSLTLLALESSAIGSPDAELWLDGLESMEELVTLHLFNVASLRRLPSLSKLGNLESLTVTNAVNLREIEGLAGLKSLKELDLTGCTCLERLPVDQLYGLKQLKSVDVRGCTNLIVQATLRNLEPNVKIQWPTQ